MITGGEWMVAYGGGRMIITDSRIPCIGETHNEDAEDNARLMAASKDLLFALTRLVMYDAKRGGLYDEILPYSEQESEIQQAMKAITKATGISFSNSVVQINNTK